MDPTDQFRLLREQGRSRDEALAELRRAGTSPMFCIKAIVEVEKLGIVEEKRAFSESPSGSDYVRRTDQSLIDELERLTDK